MVVPSAIIEGGRPRLVRRTAAGADEEEIATPSLSAAGSFVELICSGQHATVVLETDQGRKRFLIEEPTKGSLVAADGAGVQNFQCGPQKPAKIKVEYRIAEADQNVDGLVTGIYFEPLRLVGSCFWPQAPTAPAAPRSASPDHGRDARSAPNLSFIYSGR